MRKGFSYQGSKKAVLVNIKNKGVCPTCVAPNGWMEWLSLTRRKGEIQGLQCRAMCERLGMESSHRVRYRPFPVGHGVSQFYERRSRDYVRCVP